METILITLRSFLQKITRKYFLTTISVISISSIAFAQLPTAADIAAKMIIGWNIGNSLEVPSGETGWGNPLISQQLIDSVRNAGFNTIRIPCAWNSHANQVTLVIDKAFLDRVREVVDYCYNYDMYVIINCHWDGGWLEENVKPAQKDTVIVKQKAYWRQIAEYFKNYDEHLLFAGANEPNVANSTEMAVLMSYHQAFIDAVRETGGNNSSRVLIVQGPSTDIDKTNQLMKTMPVDSIEGRLMAEVHYYTPWNFCGLESDASWGKMFYFWGKDFHSSTNTARNANWGEESAVESYFKSMKTRFVDKGIPVILGEYGAIRRSSLTGEDLNLHIASREYYYKYVTNAAVRNGLIPVYWDNGYNGNNTMAIFNRGNGSVYDRGALNALIEGSKPNSVKEESGIIPEKYILQQNYPNPFNPVTKIKYSIPVSGYVSLIVYNALGEDEGIVFSGYQQAGNYESEFDASKLSSGIYLYRLQSGDVAITKKFILMK